MQTVDALQQYQLQSAYVGRDRMSEKARQYFILHAE